MLLTAMGVLHSMLVELEPRFVTCHDYSRIGDAIQAERVAHVIAPSQKLMNMLRNSLLRAVPRTSIKPGLDPQQYLIVERLQETLNVIDEAFCQ